MFFTKGFTWVNQDRQIGLRLIPFIKGVGVIMDLMKRPNEWQRRFLGVALWLTLLLTPGLSAAQLDVDEGLGTSPYNVAGPIAFIDESIGINSIGILNQGGFTNTVGNFLFMGFNPGASGTYNLGGTGSLTALVEFIGFQGSAAFNQTGGTNTATWQFATSFVGGSNSTYNLSGGNLVGNLEVIGNGGYGVFNQTGGNNTVTTFLIVGGNVGANGTYNLSFGNLAVGTYEHIGYDCPGTFIQTGGNNNVAGDFFLGRVGGGNGTYALLGGNLAVAGNYTQTAGSTLAVGIASATSYAQIPVGGAATLNGTVAPVLQGGYIPRLNQLFPGVITAAGGVTGAFSAVSNQYITPILYWQDRKSVV